MKTTAKFDTREFRLSHGCEPRGRGCWAFQYWTESGKSEPVWAAGNMTYTEAKRVAKREAQERQAYIIVVCS